MLPNKFALNYVDGTEFKSLGPALTPEQLLQRKLLRDSEARSKQGPSMVTVSGPVGPQPQITLTLNAGGHGDVVHKGDLHSFQVEKHCALPMGCTRQYGCDPCGWKPHQPFVSNSTPVTLNGASASVVVLGPEVMDKAMRYMSAYQVLPGGEIRNCADNPRVSQAYAPPSPQQELKFDDLRTGRVQYLNIGASRVSEMSRQAALVVLRGGFRALLPVLGVDETRGLLRDSTGGADKLVDVLDFQFADVYTAICRVASIRNTPLPAYSWEEICA